MFINREGPTQSRIARLFFECGCWLIRGWLLIIKSYTDFRIQVWCFFCTWSLKLMRFYPVKMRTNHIYSGASWRLRSHCWRMGNFRQHNPSNSAIQQIHRCSEAGWIQWLVDTWLQDLKPENLLLDVKGFCKAGWSRSRIHDFIAQQLAHIQS